MKKYIVTRLIVVGTIASVLLMLVSAYIQLYSSIDKYTSTATLQLDRLIEIISANNEEILTLQQELSQDYIVRAKSVAYILQKDKGVIYTSHGLTDLLSLLQIDEIHLFDKDGKIFAGTVPDYIGVDMYSGEQIGFFLPMLTDYELELVQEITPNTADEREMQYLAVWSDDREYIVQIGMEPKRLMDALEDNELDNIFSNMTPYPGITLYAMDKSTGQVIASTNSNMVGNNIISYGIDSLTETDGAIFATTIDGVGGQSSFAEYNDIILAVNESHESIYSNVLSNIIVVIVCAIATATLIIAIIYRLLDMMVLSRIDEISVGIEKITSGDLNHTMSVSGLAEFEMLSSNINSMVKSVLDSSGRLSTAIQYVNIPMALYESRQDVVSVTSKMGDIFMLDDANLNGPLKNPSEFLAMLQRVIDAPYAGEKDVFCYSTATETKYLKIKQYHEHLSSWGIILDVTEEIKDKQSIRHERDIDFLTGIFNRRAFLEHVEEISADEAMLKKATIMMMDLDNLKHVNDSWGHVYGDKFICKAAEVLQNFDYANKITARFSGDEFVIMLYGAQTIAQLDELIARLRIDFDNAYILNPQQEKYPITISGGYAIYPDNSDNFKEILHLSDQTMYEVKRTGKGRFKGYSG